MIDLKGLKIAVAGVSNQEDKFGFRIFRDLLKAGYDVEAIHPLGGERLGRIAYRDIKSVPGKIGLVITVVPPKITESIIEDCRMLGIKEVWMQPGSESDRALALACEYGISATSGKCFMKEAGIW